MSTKKTIQINPELFKMPGNKTRKNKEKKELTLNPVVSPSNLKNKLLKRIKEHKTNELKGSSLKKENNETFTDEFYGAMDYLSGLKHKQKQLQILNNKTLKNHTINNLSASSTATVNPQIFLDLPPELTEPNKTQLISNEIFNMNYKTNDGVPYGCLKNGKKKTYREWKEESSSSAYPELPDLVRPPTPPKKTDGMYFTNIKNAIETNQPEKTNNISLSREERLEQIKNKLRKMEDQETAIKRKAIEDFNTMEKTIEAKLLPELDYTDNETNNIDELIKEREKKIETMNPKQYLKKTVKRKFTLGKSDKLRRISVLIKDRQTRKNIINTQKELKKTDITDVRRYLRQHGIIKVGTTCPADILRKTFESALLAGEVTNTNKETLLHNFLSAN
jgi:hypothetical protein